MKTNKNVVLVVVSAIVMIFLIGVMWCILADIKEKESERPFISIFEKSIESKILPSMIEFVNVSAIVCSEDIEATNKNACFYIEEQGTKKLAYVKGKKRAYILILNKVNQRGVIRWNHEAVKLGCSVRARLEGNTMYFSNAVITKT